MMGRMKFNAEQCVGCYACHMACLDAHHNAREIHARSFRGISKVMDEEKGLSYEICPGCTQWSMCQRATSQDAVFGRKTMASIWWIGRNVFDAAFVRKLARIT